MSTFWKNLSRVAQDQLFTGGYLAPSTVAAIAAKRQAAAAGGGTQEKKQESKRPWPRLAALR
ncbi:MAG: hypothetical protein P4L92_23340 [Rudaea sp.]|nr:hypothetical protein [Rudaea sp.]